MAYIAYKDNLFCGVGSWEERDLFKMNGFEFSPIRKCWVTAHLDVAMRVQGVNWTKSAADYAQQCMRIQEESYDLSWQVDTSYEPPVPDRLHPRTGKPMAAMPFQKAGTYYCVQRKDSLIGDQPGLGKTVMAVLVHNATPEARSHLIVCPASLKENWRREVLLWTTKERLSVGIAEARYTEKIPDGVYKSGAKKGQQKFRNREVVDHWPDTDVVIINYDILDRFDDKIRERMWDQLTCDEAHALKTESTRRTLFVLGGQDKDRKWWQAVDARRRVMLSGTPLLNRPIELWPMIRAFDRQGLGRDKRAFEYRYCDGHQTHYGFDASGATHLEELGEKVRERFMIRRLKREVLPELPPKQRIIVTLDSPEIRELVAREDEIAEALKLYERHVQGSTLEETEALQGAMITQRAQAFGLDKAYRSEDGEVNTRVLKMDYAAAVLGLEPSAVEIMFDEMARIRHDLGVAKLSAAVPWIKDFLDGGEKLLTFAYHADVVEGIRDRLKEYEPAVVYGKTPIRKRQPEVDRFMEDEACRLFDGNIYAAGVGYTMTVADTVAFVEGDWVPAQMEQAIDRVLRIGQTSDMVTGYFLVANGSLDARIAQSAKVKEDNIVLALDTRRKVA